MKKKRVHDSVDCSNVYSKFSQTNEKKHQNAKMEKLITFTGSIAIVQQSIQHFIQSCLLVYLFPLK